MVASLLRLFHNGLQDVRLSGVAAKQKVSLDAFQYVLVKAGRFTTQWQRIDFDTKPAFGTFSVCKLPRKGHLISRVYLVATMPDIRTAQMEAMAKAGDAFAGPIFGWTNSLGHAMIESLQLDIGGARVEQFDGRLMEILDEFYTPLEKVANVNELIKRKPNGFNAKSFGWDEANTQVVVPLPFWFCNGDIASALPIDGLYADEVKTSFKFRNAGALYTTPARSLPVQSVDASGQIVQPPSLKPLCKTDVSRGGGSQNTAVESLVSIQGTKFYQYDASGFKIPGLVPGQPDALFKEIEGSSMPDTFILGDTYLLVEYIYLDKPEANRFRQAEFTMPIIQHYLLDPVDTKGGMNSLIPLRIANPTRHLFFFAQRAETVDYNAYFLATRDLSGGDVKVAPWWPDCSGLAMESFQPLRPAFSTRFSEPIQSFDLTMEGKFVRYSTENMALFRSILPSLDMRKSPLFNRYFYCLPFSLQSGRFPGSIPLGEANLDKIPNITLNINFEQESVFKQVYPRYTLYMYVETYNVLKMFGGRAGLLFGY